VDIYKTPEYQNYEKEAYRDYISNRQKENLVWKPFPADAGDRLTG